MISEAAYYQAERRGFQGGDPLNDWLTAEHQVRQLISPKSQPLRQLTHAPATHGQPARSSPDATQGVHEESSSNFAKFAATQAAGDGIEGDLRKPGKTVDEKIASNMADRK